MDKKSMIWLGPGFIGAFVGVAVALVIVGLLVIPSLGDDDEEAADNNQQTVTDVHDDDTATDNEDNDHQQDNTSDDASSQDDADLHETDSQGEAETSRIFGG